jgi:hypothetical protein
LKSHYDIHIPIVWTGDLEDDCTATWNGLLLRAEWMHDEIWWWAVSEAHEFDNIDSSNEHDEKITSGAMARKRAESCARDFLQNAYYVKHFLDIYNRRLSMQKDGITNPAQQIKDFTQILVDKLSVMPLDETIVYKNRALFDLKGNKIIDFPDFNSGILEE